MAFFSSSRLQVTICEAFVCARCQKSVPVDTVSDQYAVSSSGSGGATHIAKGEIFLRVMMLSQQCASATRQQPLPYPPGQRMQSMFVF